MIAFHSLPRQPTYLYNNLHPILSFTRLTFTNFDFISKICPASGSIGLAVVCTYRSTRFGYLVPNNFSFCGIR